jgi:hypothetical protein
MFRELRAENKSGGKKTEQNTRTFQGRILHTQFFCLRIKSPLGPLITGQLMPLRTVSELRRAPALERRERD